ncbi:MAG: hypothetical protein EOP90_12660 [Lysobacteraceae bacterium]|nr:MAG: hypothetical protein EOP90_12660 [Xanthomonadaceae bacterium]
MSLSLVTLLLLGFAVLAGIVRSLRDGRAHRIARPVLQVLVGVALALGLFPPMHDEPLDAATLVVLTPSAEAAPGGTPSRAARVVALPGAQAARAIERVPDLASALRRHPDARRLHVVGGGLPARDRDAARGRVVAFDEAPLPAGLVELEAPQRVATGARWLLAGRVARIDGSRVELLDPAGEVIASATPGSDGRFALAAQARAQGRLLFALRVVDAAGVQRERVELPLFVRDGVPLRVHVLAGAPDPDLKYLRRWASDAGLALDSRIRLSDGIALTEGGLAALDPAALAATDLVVVDERAWALLDAGQKAALRGALEAGLGLLLRVTGVPDATTVAEWAALGFGIEHVAATANVALAGMDAADAQKLTPSPVRVDARDATPLLRAADGSVLAAWRIEGHGRIGAWWLADSFRLVLAGDPARHASLWASTFSTLARAQASAQPALPTRARVDERVLICGMDGAARVEAPDRTSVALVPVAMPDGRACAAYFPTERGWHELLAGARRWPFHVRGVDDARTLAAAETARATRALVGGAAASTRAATPVRLPRWPFLLAWLALASMLWWLERRARAAA